MPLSSDPDKRARQLANLEPGAGQWSAGASPALKHGLRSRSPARVVLDPVVREIEDALAADLPLRDPDGGVPGPDRFAVELAAIALLRVRRCWAYLELHGDVDERGNMRQAFLELGRAVEYAARMLDRLGMSPRARASLGVDVAKVVDLSTALSEPDDELRARLLAETGVLGTVDRRARGPLLADATDPEPEDSPEKKS